MSPAQSFDQQECPLMRQGRLLERRDTLVALRALTDNMASDIESTSSLSNLEEGNAHRDA